MRELANSTPAGMAAAEFGERLSQRVTASLLHAYRETAG